MPSEQLSVVNDHLRALAACTAAAGRGQGLAALRRMTEQYGVVDAACGRLHTAVAPTEVAGVPAEWHIAPGADLGRRLLYLHGGGWMAGSLSSHRAMVSTLTAAIGGVGLALDYRLAPEHGFPAGLDDCVAAYRWLRANGPDGPSPARATAIAGDSAGGNLTLATLIVLRDSGDPLPDAAVALSPVTTFRDDGESRTSRREADPIISGEGGMGGLAKLYLQGAAEPTDPRAAPLEDTCTGLPPILIETGDAEVLLSDSVDYAARAKAAGADVTLTVTDHMPHIFPIFAGFLPEADEAMARIAAFITERC